MPSPTPWQVRLWRRVSVGWENDCWEWTGSTTTSGYGQIRTGGRGPLAATHRLSWNYFYGPIPEGMFVCHRCDNPPCVNPAHLFLGSHQDNMRDAKAKGRTSGPYGELSPSCRLTSEQAADIRSRYVRHYRRYSRGWASNADELAAEFGVTSQHVSRIGRGVERQHG